MTAENNYEEVFEEVREKLDKISNIKELDVLDIKNSVESIENLITDTQAKLNFQDIKEKLEKIAFQVDNCNDALLKDLYNDLNTLKESTSSVSQHLENLQNVQNLALTSAEFEEYQKQQLDLALKTNENIFHELKSLNETTQKTANPENIKNIETQLSNLHKALTGYIEQVVSKIELVPGVQEIGSVVSDLNSVHQKSIKQTNALIKEVETKLDEFKTHFDKKDFSQQISKISEIYDSLGMINAWIEKVGYINQSIENVYARLGESIDFDDVSEKVDIIYENITALNNWTMKIDKVDESMLDIQTKLSSLSDFMPETQNITNTINTIKEHFEASLSEKVDFEDMGNKMDIVYENLSAINSWANKVDKISENIETVSDKIETVSDKITNINDVIEEESIASKIDVVYENISLLNEWVSKIDGLTQKSEELDSKYTNANESLNTRIDELNENLSKALQTIQDVPDIKDKLNELSGELHAITSTTKNDTESYIYTLLDIESDFLKLHKFLDDKTNITSNDINALKERFAELNDDISSISVRTNKLILSSDDANKEFKETLELFKNTIQELDEKTQLYNPELKFTILNDKVTEIADLLKDTTTASKNLNNAFIYLADWVDATGNVLNGMQNDILSVKEDNNSSKISFKLLEGDVSDLIKKTEEKDEALKEAHSQIHNEIETVTDDLSSIKQDVSSVNEDINLIKEGMAVLGEGMDNVLKDINTYSESIDSLKTKGADYKKEISSIIDKIEAFEASFDNFKTDDISELKSSLTGIMVQLNTALTPDIDSLNSRIDKFVEENQNYKEKFEEALEEKLNKQEQKITALENKIDTLTSKVDKLVDTLSEGNKNDEIKDILNYLVTQLAAANDGITTNQQNAHKVLNDVADKLSSFDDNINKIVNYIEE